MMRPATLVLFALAVAAGGTLFGVAFEVSELEERLAALNKEIRQDRDAIHVLRAEWSYLNQPERLEGLTRRYLDLQPLEGGQMAEVAALPTRPTPVAEAETPEAGQVAAADDAQEPEQALARALTARPKVKPAAPSRPSGPVQLAAHAEAVADPDTAALDAALRAILGPAAPRDGGQQ